jgi:hypothetical protein
MHQGKAYQASYIYVLNVLLIVLQDNKNAKFQNNMCGLVKMKHDGGKGEDGEIVKSCLALISSEGDNLLHAGSNGITKAILLITYRKFHQE